MPLVHPAIPQGGDGNKSAPLTVDSSGNLLVAVSGGAAGGTSLADQGTFTEASTNFTPIGGEYKTSPTALTSGQGGTCQVTQNRALHANLRNASGTEVGTLATAIRVDPTGTTAQPVTGTFWQATQPVSGTFWQATQPVSLAATVVIKADTAANQSNLLKVDASGTTVPVSGTFWQATQPVSLASLPALATGTNTIGSVKLASGGAGWSVNSQTALSSTKATVSSAAGHFGGYMIYNPNTSVIYVQVFDVASASVTVGTTTPTYVIPIPASAGANVEFTLGIAHATAIVVAATTTATGSTAPGTALTGFFLYK
jgi:hypothetical protein